MNFSKWISLFLIGAMLLSCCAVLASCNHPDTPDVPDTPKDTDPVPDTDTDPVDPETPSVPLPMLASKRSLRPRLEQMFRSCASSM